jgi:hypothetical protein
MSEKLIDLPTDIDIDVEIANAALAAVVETHGEKMAELREKYGMSEFAMAVVMGPVLSDMYTFGVQVGVKMEREDAATE